MTKNRLDKKIREVLEDRRIVPTDQAWQTLEKQLDVPEKAEGISFWKYGVAAGIIGILLVSVYLGTRGVQTGIPQGAVVKSGIEAVDSRPSEDGKDPGHAREEVAVIPAAVDETKPLVAGDHPDDDRTVEGEIIPVTAGSKEGLAAEFVPLEKLEIKVAEVVAQVSDLEDSGGYVEDAVIDSLLRAAQEQLLEQRITMSPDKVDAMALLSDVEGELNRSLRDQLFEKLKEGYERVRTAIAYRND